MAGQTPRFGFNHFGSGTPGTPNDDGQKFFGLDRLTLDRLLASVESHDHRYHPPVAALTEPLAATLSVNGGKLKGGFTYYYRYAVVDSQGNESVAGPEVVVETPAPLGLPGQPSAFHDETGPAGGLPPGMYYYALSAIRGSEETPLGPAVLIQTLAGETTVTLQMPDFGQADAVRVWRMGSTEPGYTRLQVVNRGTATYLDDGTIPADPCSCDPGNMPPSANTGMASYSVELELPAEVDLAETSGWRLYRSMTAGVYPSASLVHYVVEREQEWDPGSPLLRKWIDVGGTLTAGKPLTVDRNMRFQLFAFEVVEELPDPTPYPEGYPLLMLGKLYVRLAGEWKAVTSSGGGGGGGGNILTSPQGWRYALKVDSEGVLMTEYTNLAGPPAEVQVVYS